MNAKSFTAWLFAGLLAMGTTAMQAQSAGQSLGTVRLTQRVVADGQTLPAGTYTVRLTDAAVTPVVGQSPQSAHWVEFLQGGQVKGRELATVVPQAELKAVTDLAPPASGSAKVQTLRGGDYLRIWVNRGGTQYLVHLATGAPVTAAR